MSLIEEFSHLESLVNKAMEQELTKLQNRSWVIQNTILYYFIFSLLFLLYLTPSLFTQLGTGIIASTSTSTILVITIVVGGLVFVAISSIYGVIVKYIADKINLSDKPVWVGGVFTYIVVSIYILGWAGYQNYNILKNDYIYTVLLWLALSGFIIGLLFVFLSFVGMFTARVGWLWGLSITYSKPAWLDRRPGYLAFINSAAKQIKFDGTWNEHKWRILRGMAEARLNAANSHAQAASFVLATIALLGLLPAIATQAWNALIALIVKYFQAFNIDQSRGDPELGVQMIFLVILSYFGIVALNYFVREAWHLRIAETIIYIADEKIYEESIKPKTVIPTTPISESNSTLQPLSIIIGAILAVIIWLLQHIFRMPPKK